MSNKQLPKRPRSHQLEGASIDKFKAGLPPEWVYRTPTDDYGIDGEVEIFDNDGYSTGKKFLVQLKATDEENLNKALKLRMPIEKYNYFKQLKAAVLIVRYLAKTNEIYFRWFHSLNSTQDTVAEESFSIKYDATNLWRDDSSVKLQGDLDTYLILEGKRLPIPFKIDVIISPVSALSSFTMKFASQLINISQCSRNVLSFQLTPKVEQAGSTYVKVFDKEYYINFGNVCSFRGSFSPPDCNITADKIVCDIVVCIAFLLIKMGFTSEAESLYEQYLKQSNIGRTEQFSLSFIWLKVSLNKVSDALEHIIYLAESDGFNDSNVCNIIQLGMSILRSKTTDEQKELVEETYLKLAEIVNPIDPMLEGVFYYNTGNILRERNENRKAIKLYLKAAKSNYEYLDNDYWIKELAGLFFLTGKHNWSVSCYKVAVQKNDTPRTRMLLADSLMFAGKFKEALEEFSNSIDLLDERDVEWCLKIICLEVIVDQLGVTTQSLGAYAGQEFIKTTNEDSATQYLKDINALCPDCWFYLGDLNVEKSNFESASICFLISALSDESCAISWRKALQCSFNMSDHSMFYSIINLAIIKHDQRVIVDFIDSLNFEHNQESNEIAIQLMKYCQEVRKDKNDNSIEFRIHGEESIFLER